MNTTVSADAKFLHRVFLGLVLLTLTFGALGISSVQAMQTPGETQQKAASSK